MRDLLSGNPEFEQAAFVPGQPELNWACEQALCDALDSAVDLVTWSAEPQISQPIERWIGILLPIFDAFEAGLWLWWVTPGEVLALLRPTVRYQNRWLHCEEGPAVVSPAAPSWYFWRGVRVPEKVVLRPLDLTAHEIVSEEDAEVRRVMLERYGPERFIQDIGATRVDADETGELYCQELEDDEPLCMVRVLDATPQFVTFMCLRVATAMVSLLWALRARVWGVLLRRSRVDASVEERRWDEAGWPPA